MNATSLIGRTHAVLYESSRWLYTQLLRKQFRNFLLKYAEDSFFTRQLLYQSPPEYVESFHEFDNEEYVTITTPNGLGPVPDSFQEVVRTWKFVPPFVTVLKNVDLLGPHALPITPDQRFVIEAADGSTLRVTDEIVRSIGSGVAPLNRGTGKRYETVVSLAGQWSSEYFHWFADYLPRLRFLERWKRKTGIRPLLMIPTDPPSWVRESLDLLGIDRDRRVEWPGGRVSVDRLIIPSMPRHTLTTGPSTGYIHSPRELGWVRDRLLDAVSTEIETDIGTRLYVSRSKQPSRHVRNEGQLISVAREYGFEKIHPEDWSLEKQIAVFREADAVIGPHGAGLINVIYGNDIRLIELFGERTNPCFFAIADGMNIPYWMMQCRNFGSDLYVDPKELDELINTTINDVV